MLPIIYGSANTVKNCYSTAKHHPQEKYYSLETKYPKLTRNFSLNIEGLNFKMTTTFRYIIYVYIFVSLL